MIASYALTDVGRVRMLNEDAIHAGDGLFVVCDGMGGHRAGEVASALAVEAISGFIGRTMKDPDATWPFGYDPSLSHEANRLATAIKLANRVVFRTAASVEDYAGMGTTVAAALVEPGHSRMTYAHVGDSRIYLVRSGLMWQLTRDDTWASLAPSEDAGSAPPAMPNVLTKALGAREDVDISLGVEPLRDADVVLLCSDGLSNMLPASRIQEVVLTRSHDLELACRELVARANARGGRDNISIILVRHTAEPR
jgi:protein phosphatase